MSLVSEDCLVVLFPLGTIVVGNDLVVVVVWSSHYSCISPPQLQACRVHGRPRGGIVLAALKTTNKPTPSGFAMSVVWGYVTVVTLQVTVFTCGIKIENTNFSVHMCQKSQPQQLQVQVVIPALTTNSTQLHIYVHLRVVHIWRVHIMQIVRFLRQVVHSSLCVCVCARARARVCMRWASS